jgi:uncharacterized alpha/beta hydrolase family protein
MANMMKMKTILLFILMVIIIGFLIGCTETTNNNSNEDSNEESRFVGTWDSEENPDIIPIKLILNSDGTSTVNGMNSTWELKNGQLIVTIIDLELVSTFDYFFTENDTILHLRLEGNDVFDIYFRQ